MAEEIQGLIERIRSEGVERAEKEAAEILSHAKEQAAAVVRQAEEKAQAIIAKAEKDSEAFTRRSIKTLEQAARDLLITVGQGVENILSDLAAEAVDEALTIEVVEKMLVKIAEAIAAREGDSRIEILISPDDQKELVQFFADRYRKKLIHGIELHVDNGIVKGFKVSLVEDYVYHDFTREAIAESLGNFLRPHLAEIVHRVAREKQEDVESRNGQGEASAGDVSKGAGGEGSAG